MKKFRNLFSIVFVVATLLSSLHHHKDLQSHSDCKICTLQYDLSSGDIPSETVSISDIEPFSEAILSTLNSFEKRSAQTSLNSRAPPLS